MRRFEQAKRVASTPEEWLASPLGCYLAEHEQRWFDHTAADLFGFNAVQIGVCGIATLQQNRMPLRVCIDIHAGDLRAFPEQLPLATQSIDMIALPHVLEFSPHPHQVLREVERVLRPEGRVLISGFNPFSLWGLRRKVSEDGYPWHGQFLHLSRVRDWLQLLGFEVLSGRMACYAPPINRAGWPGRFACLEAAGDRWWALGGGVYMLHAVKRVHGMRLLTPRRRALWQRTQQQPALVRGTGRIQIDQ